MSPRRVLFVASALALGRAAAYAQNPPITLGVDAVADRRPINPLVYGVAFASTAELADLNCPLNRSGGNTTSRYNWQANADNRGFDWYFESLSYPSATPGELGDTFISETRAAAKEPMLTIPMVGWVAKLGNNRGRLCSYSIVKYGSQTGNDWQWFPDAGNGVRTDGTEITNNDPNDANTPADGVFQQGWMQHLVTQWGSASAGGLRYYALDNEPSLWHETHRDVHPVGATMDEMRDKILDYASRIKAIDPSATVVAPEEWGWLGYLMSGYDQQWAAQNGWGGPFPDREAHGGWLYLPWLLDQLRQNDVATGQRKVDAFTVHYYPQGGEFGGDTSTAMQQRRNRSTRSLWDPNYVDESWIDDTVRLIPRLKQWVTTYYPGTPIGITEYNWGAEGHINGATTQADILGIFGREGLDMAARWTTPTASTPTYKAIKIYRNYDGSNSTFGDTSVRVVGADPDRLSAFAATRSADGALTVMVVAKSLSGSTPVTVGLSNFIPAGNAQVWQLTSANAITRLADIGLSSGSFTTSVPPQSITLFIVPPGGVGCPMIGINPSSIPVGRVGTSFNQTFTQSGGNGNVVLSLVGTLPSGLTFDPGTATLSGTPSQPGQFRLTVSATDPNACRRDKAYTLTITSASGTAPTALAVDAAGNSVLDPTDSSVTVAPTWFNNSGGSITPTGTLGSPSAGLNLGNDTTASYPTIANDAMGACTNCFTTVSAPGPRPGQHWDAVSNETLAGPSDTKTWTFHVGGSFSDVPASNSFYRFIETLFHKGVTTGCGANIYCPTSSTTRGQMAVFLLRSKLGGSYNPPGCTGIFQDVPCQGNFFAPFIEDLYNRRITLGCSASPLLYCPTSTTTRAQMAAFLLRALEGSAYVPAACQTPPFDDVPTTHALCPFIQEIKNRQITQGCGGGNYCPTSPVNRGQMAAFLTRTFSLGLYEP